MNPTSYSINLHSLGLCGTVFLCLGLLLSVAGMVFFLAAGSAISIGPHSLRDTMSGVLEETHDGGGSLSFHDSHYILVSGREKLVYLLPLAAGILLTASGLLIRSKLPAYREVEQSLPAVQSGEP